MADVNLHKRTQSHKQKKHNMTSYISQLGWTDEDDVVLLESVVLNKKDNPEILNSDFIEGRKEILKILASRFKMRSLNLTIRKVLLEKFNKDQVADFTEQKFDILREHYHKLKNDETKNENTIVTVPTAIKEKKVKKSKSKPKSPQSNRASSSRTSPYDSTKGTTIKFTGNGTLSCDPSFLIQSENDDGRTWINGVKLFVMTSTSKLAPLVFQDPEDFNHFANLLKEDLGEPVEDFFSLNNSILTCIKDTCEVMEKNLARKQNRIAISSQSFSNNTIQMTHDTNDVYLTLHLTEKTLVSELKKVVDDYIQESNLENEEEFQEDLEYDTDSKSDASHIVLHVVVIEPKNEASCVNCSYEVETSESVLSYMQSVRCDDTVRQNIIGQAKRFLQLPSDSLEDIHLSNVEAGEGRSIRVTFKATLPKDTRLVKAFNIQNHGSHKVYFEQRVIANELFKRTRNLIGEDRFSQFDKLEFLVCSPNQNTLYEQNMKRLNDARSGIHFGPIEQVAVKYYKKHIKVFEEFKERAKKNKNTFFVIVADECHFAITKGNAHDTFVNDWQHVGTDSWAMSMDNIFVLQISATPYNILSKDSIIPERYELKEDLEAVNTTKNCSQVIPRGHMIRVVDDKYTPNQSPYIIHPLRQVSPMYGAKIEASDFQYLGDVFSIRSSRLPDHFGDLKAQDLVFATKVNDTYEIRPIDITDGSKTVTITTREFNSKLQKSKDVFCLTQDIQCPLNINLESFTIDSQVQPAEQLRKGEVVQVYRRVKWAVKFVVESSGDNDIYEVDDLEFRFATGYCSEENIVTWDKAQKANDHSNDVMRDHDDKFDMKYRSKSFYISTMKTDKPLIRQDTFGNKRFGRTKRTVPESSQC